MRDLHGHVRLLADRDGFLKRFERAVGLVANMAHVEAAALGGDRRQGDQLFRVAVAADLIFESARETDGAFPHSAIDERRHPGHFLVARGPLVVIAHHRTTYRRVADHHQDVHSRRVSATLGQVLSDRPRRRSVRAHHQRRDALRNLGFGRGIRDQRGRRMVVDIDEAGSQDEPLCRDDRVTWPRRHIPDVGDVVAFDPDVAGPERAAGAIGEACAHNGDRAGGWCGGRKDRHRQDEDADWPHRWGARGGVVILGESGRRCAV